MFSAALYARVRFSLPVLHTGPRVQRASGIPFSLILRDNDMQTSGRSRRENADAHLLFEIESGMSQRHCEPTSRGQSMLTCIRYLKFESKNKLRRPGQAATRAP